MKTAEEILNKVLDLDEQDLKETSLENTSLGYYNAIIAMEEYANQFKCECDYCHNPITGGIPVIIQSFGVPAIWCSKCEI